MSWLEEANDVSAFPAIAAHAALIFALRRRARARRAVVRDGAGRRPDRARCPDGSTVEATLAYLGAIEARAGHGADADATRAAAWAGLSPASPLRATMRTPRRSPYLLEGDLDRADDLFVEALEAAELAGVDPLVAMVLCERATIAVERGDWPSAVTCGPARDVDRRRRRLRLVLDQRARVRLGSSGRRAPRPARPRRVEHVRRRPGPAPAAHVRAPGRLHAGAADHRAGVAGPGRPPRGRGCRAAGPGDRAPATRARRPARQGRRPCSTAGAGGRVTEDGPTRSRPPRSGSCRSSPRTSRSR